MNRIAKHNIRLYTVNDNEINLHERNLIQSVRSSNIKK